MFFDDDYDGLYDPDRYREYDLDRDGHIDGFEAGLIEEDELRFEREMDGFGKRRRDDFSLDDDFDDDIDDDDDFDFDDDDIFDDDI